jgi:hypothetical protein
MLLGPRRPLLVRVLARVAALWPQDRAATAADLRYLDSMSAERLERDLGLTRRADHRYRPY